jgi:hypothetical protein
MARFLIATTSGLVNGILWAWLLSLVSTPILAVLAGVVTGISATVVMAVVLSLGLTEDHADNQSPEWSAWIAQPFDLKR